MASLAQILRANSPAQAALVAAGLRKGQITNENLVKPGMYDPNLDFQQQNENQGFGWTTQDYNLGNTELHEDVFGGTGSYVDPVTGQRTDYSTPGALAEILQTRDKNVGRANEDHTTALANLATRYQRMAGAQSTAARGAGLGQGALAQALRKRTANKATDQAPIDTGWRRYVDDENQGAESSRNSVLQQAGRGQGRADIGYGRAGAANTTFNTQIGQAKVLDAQGRGLLPELPGPDFRGGEIPAGQALANAYNDPNRPRVPVPATYSTNPNFFKPKKRIR